MELSSGDFRIREANMAAYYTSSSNQRDNPMIYSRENLSATYPESQFPQRDNPMMGLHPPASFTDTSAGTSNSVGGFEASDSASQQQNQVMCSLDSSSRMQELQEFGSWRGNSTRNGIMLMNPMTSPTSILQTGQGLSLSLGSQILPGIHQMNQPISFRNNPNPGGSREEQNRTNEFMASGFSGGNRTIPSSKYLKAAQELLDEVVNVKKALRQSQPDHEKNRENSGDRQNTNSKDGVDSNNDSNPRELSGNSSNHMSHGEKQELQSKLTKLLSMLDEVDRRYKQYYHQMQIVVSSFDVIAGVGAAKPYTALALQTISRHFRCLRDAISGQISATRKSLGEQDSLDNKNVGITRLRYVDQKLKQQRALQQLGMTQHHHAWRPQRGLPENSVSILRAWLFEHFLHPYPKDSDKIILARQTGLTRSQVSNWFINARVRLWKPMVEEMYKEEFADAEMDSNSSSENLAAKTTKHDEARSQTPSGTPNAGRNPSQQTESKSDHTIPDVETRYSLGPDSVIIHHDHSGMADHRFMASAAAQQYHMEAEMGGRSNVSLTLGLQGSDGDLPEMPGGNRYGFLYQNATEPTGFEYVDPSNQQDRFSSSHLLHDFVA